MGQTNSNPVWLYTRFIRILKIIEYLGYFAVVFWGLMYLLFAGGIFPQASLTPLDIFVLLLSCCASNLTVNFFIIIVGRAGEPVSVFNLDA